MTTRIGDLVEELEHRATEAHAARTQAEQSDKVKSAFLASMSHELRTPLNAVINFTRFVVKGMMGPVTEEQKETLEQVIDSGKHLLALINDVLDMSKIEAGSLRLFVEDNVDMNALLKQALETARAMLADKPVKLEAALQPLPPMMGDRQRILQVLLNILSNACKYTEHGTVKVGAYALDGEIHITVADTGPGISLEDQPLIFIPFRQTETGLRQGSGTGLGMPISKNLVSAHEGRLWLESTPGLGSTFFVALPVRARSLQPLLNAVPATN